jgi:Zn-dependent M28 family amino/carboxypeptidase
MRPLILLLLLAVPGYADIRTDIEFLASDALRGRASGSPGILTAQNYIIAALEAEGILVSTQKVVRCQNVIATIEGAQPGSYIVVGAHLDHIGVNLRKQVMNGADDNASGSAAILELAKRTKKAKPLRSVVFVWFTREETGMNGSRTYADEPPRGKSPVFMLNLDMVGHLNSGGAERAPKVGELADLFERYPFARKITNRSSKRGSDQRSFNAICPTIFLNTGLNGPYHSSLDDADTLDYPGIEKVCDYAFGLIMQTCGREIEYKF